MIPHFEESPGRQRVTQAIPQVTRRTWVLAVAAGLGQGRAGPDVWRVPVTGLFQCGLPRFGNYPKGCQSKSCVSIAGESHMPTTVGLGKRGPMPSEGGLALGASSYSLSLCSRGLGFPWELDGSQATSEQGEDLGPRGLLSSAPTAPSPPTHPSSLFSSGCPVTFFSLR